MVHGSREPDRGPGAAAGGVGGVGGIPIPRAVLDAFSSEMICEKLLGNLGNFQSKVVVLPFTYQRICGLNIPEPDFLVLIFYNTNCLGPIFSNQISATNTSNQKLVFSIHS